MAENMLRRKTPNGTLNDAYESSNHDAQAAKHMLLQRNGAPHPYGQVPQMPQMDSVLNQQAPLPMRYMNAMTHPFFGQSVPSVMQPPFQQLGPTASGIDGRGLYGPYWNDGTFVPYRPAALRDPRYYAHHDFHYSPQQPLSHWNSAAPGLAYPTPTNPWSLYGNGMPSVYPSFAGVHGPSYVTSCSMVPTNPI